MQYIDGAADIKRHNKSVVVLGNFDGVHKGHQKLFEVAKGEAHKKGLDTIVFSFYPHPTWVIGNKRKSLLMNREDKKQMIEKLGLDVLVEYPFTKEFASQSPEAFFIEVLVKKLNACVLVVGSNYYFGKNKAGNTDFLKKMGMQYGIKVHVVEAVMIEEKMISSSKIRDLVLKGKMEEATKMLGHSYKVIGRVEQGKKLGRTLGFPTINLIADSDYVYPPNGVYATRVKVYSKTYVGMTNIGFNPTVSGQRKMIETHIIGFNESIYGEKVEIEFYHFMRPEKKFEDIEALRKQLVSDKEKVQQFFSETRNKIAK